MARRKTITKDQILNAAYDVVATEGFSRLTARNIASKMKCSTQPIYLEFKNMDDLKDELFEKIHDYLEQEVLSEEHTGDIIIDISLNYIHFACNEKTLYRAMFVEDYEDNQKTTDFAYRMFMREIDKEDSIRVLPESKKKELLTGTWIVATGIASLYSGGLIHPNDKDIITMMENVISSILLNDPNPSFI